MYDRILVCTDGSSLSKKAVTHALKLARSCGASVVAFHTVPRYPQSYFEGGVALSAVDVGAIEAQWRERGEGVVADVIKAGEAMGVKVKPVVVNSDLVSEAVIKAASKNKCDLIVMASHGRRGLKRVLLGSETQGVLTHADVPVLVLR